MARAKKTKLLNPDPVFVPVHAASMSTPIYAQLVSELGEPNLNPAFDAEEPHLWLNELFELHKPMSMREFVPDWAKDTGMYLADRAAYANYVDGLKRDKEAADGTADSAVHSSPAGSTGT